VRLASPPIPAAPRVRVRICTPASVDIPRGLRTAYHFGDAVS